MEFKKCVRCGNFFVTEGEVCQCCLPKDKVDLMKFQDYVNRVSGDSASNISINTGISMKNVNRYLNQ